MAEGRLIRVGKFKNDPRAIAYIVATADKKAALQLAQDKIAAPADYVEDLGRVSDSLLKALNLPAGGFAPVNGVRTVQEQQPPQADKLH